MLQVIAVISAGASLGAVLRWLLSYHFNAIYATLPLGTLLANLIGGYLIGLAVGVFSSHPSIAPEWRLLIVTGFLGGLTTFSTFSLEAVTLLQQGRLANALALIALHVTASLLLTLLGIWSASLWRA